MLVLGSLAAAVAIGVGLGVLLSVIEMVAHGGIPFRTALAVLWMAGVGVAAVAFPLRTLWERVFSPQRPRSSRLRCA